MVQARSTHVANLAILDYKAGQSSRKALEPPTKHHENHTYLLMPHPDISFAEDEGKTEGSRKEGDAYLVEEEYLVTALVPSDTACLASSPGRMSRTLASRDQFMIEECIKKFDLRSLNLSG